MSAVRYANGRLPASELVTVQGSLTLPRACGAAFSAARSSIVRQTGRAIVISSPFGAYRPFEMQVYMHENEEDFSQGVAAPGYSVHGQTPGCVDINNWAAFGEIRWDTRPRGRQYSAALDRLMAPFGFRRTMPNEGWHYQYDGTTTAGGDVSPFPVDDEEDEMGKPEFHMATDNTGLVSANVGVNDWWVRPAPGLPLARMTEGQKTDAFRAQGISAGPFNHDNVFSHPGSWFAAAFEEDRIAHGYNVLAHPYEAGGVASLDASTRQFIADELDAATDRVLEAIDGVPTDLANRLSNG